jgi:membrane protease YdiL (CAAX protease family)
MHIKKSLYTLALKIITFYFLVMYIGQQLFKFLSYGLLNELAKAIPDWQSAIQNIISLDYGRFIGRVGALIGTILVFSIYSRLIDGVSLKNSVLWPNNKLSYFLKGGSLGAFMVLLMIALVLLSHSIDLIPVSYWPSYLLPTIVLYVIGMICTAITEELVFRGYILENLLKKLNPNIAIILSAVPFGLLHIYSTGSYLYGLQAILFGLLAGYAYVWTRNLYFAIGIHFAWNCIESVIFSQYLFTVNVSNALLAGAKNITPDREGLLSLPALIIGFLIMMFYKRKLNECSVDLPANNQ